MAAGQRPERQPGGADNRVRIRRGGWLSGDVRAGLSPQDLGLGEMGLPHYLLRVAEPGFEPGRNSNTPLNHSASCFPLGPSDHPPHLPSGEDEEPLWSLGLFACKEAGAVLFTEGLCSPEGEDKGEEEGGEGGHGEVQDGPCGLLGEHGLHPESRGEPRKGTGWASEETPVSRGDQIVGGVGRAGGLLLQAPEEGKGLRPGLGGRGAGREARRRKEN